MAKLSAFDKAANVRDRMNNLAKVMVEFGGKVGGTFDDLQQQLDTIEKRLADIDSHLDHLAGRLDVVESSSASYRFRQFGAWVRNLVGGA